MNVGRLAISFDDGRLDNKMVIEDILLPGDIPSTIFVTTGYVDGSCPYEKLPTIVPALSIADVIQLSKEKLVEVGLHGDQHLNEDWDIEAGRKKLLEWSGYPDDHRFGLASPNSRFPIDHFLDSKGGFYSEYVAYLALGLRLDSFVFGRTMARKAGRVFHSPLFYRMAYRDTCMSGCPDRLIYRVPVLADTKPEQIKGLVDDIVNRKEALVLMFHSIGGEANDPWTWDTGKFRKLCAYLLWLKSEEKIELLTVQNLVRKIEIASNM